MFERVEIPQKPINVYVKTNDNSINVRGHGPDGFIDRTVLTDDPKAESKVNDLLQAIHDYHAGQLEDAKVKLDEQFPKLKDSIGQLFEGDKEKD